MAKPKKAELVERDGWRGSADLVPMLVDIDTLSPDPANARDHTERDIEAKMASLRRFGQQRVPAVGTDSVCTAGSGILIAAKRLGWKELAVSVSPLEGAERAAYAIADNRTGDLSRFHTDTLLHLIDTLPDELHEAAGFTKAELDLLASGDPNAGMDTTAGGERTGSGEKYDPNAPNKYENDGQRQPVRGKAEIIVGDVLKILPTLEAESFDAVLSDPPYGLSFMGKAWDHGVPGEPVWREVSRLLRPGAHVLAFGGTRTFHRLAVGIEDAGFEIRDCLSWLYGSGFPKSLDVSKAIDSAAGATRPVIGTKLSGIAVPGEGARHTIGGSRAVEVDITAPATPEAEVWSGYGTALKPAWEPCLVAMKPTDGTFAQNALRHGVAGVNVDGGRIGMSDRDAQVIREMGGFGRSGYKRTPGEALNLNKNPMPCRDADPHPAGRWPANVILDEEAAARLDAEVGELKAGVAVKRNTPVGKVTGSIYPRGNTGVDMGYADSGGPSRFFYCAKASRDEREAGLREAGGDVRSDGGAQHTVGVARAANHHPTVKPLRLCEWLARLVLPPDIGRPRRILVPFSGSGSEVIGALFAGWDEVVGVELSDEYAEIARARIAFWSEHGPHGADEPDDG